MEYSRKYNGNLTRGLRISHGFNLPRLKVGLNLQDHLVFRTGLRGYFVYCGRFLKEYKLRRAALR